VPLCCTIGFGNLMAELVVKPSAKGVIGYYALSSLLLVGAIYYLYRQDFPKDWRLGLIAIPLVIDVWAAMKHVRLNYTKLTLAGETLRYEDGMMSKAMRTMVLSKLQDVRVDQSMGQRLVGVGDLSIETTGENSRITIRNIDQPHLVAEQILAAMPKHRA
jgi:uncharacterized membrane protein YdbT with pleckstrin-like domain